MITVNTKALRAALSACLRIAKTQTIYPPTSFVRLDISDHLRLYATNTVVALSVEVPLISSDGISGRCLIDGKALHQLLATFGEETSIDLKVKADASLKGDDLQVRNPGVRATFKSIYDVEALPLIDATSDSAAFACTVDAKAYLAAIAKVAYACSIDDTRPLITMVNHRYDSTRIMALTATDGRRMSRATLPVDGDFSPFNVRPQGLAALNSLVTSGQIEISLHKDWIVYRSGPVTMHSFVYLGAYPSIDHVIDWNAPHSVTVDPNHLLKVAKRIASVSSAISLAVEASGDGARLHLCSKSLTANPSDRFAQGCDAAIEDVIDASHHTGYLSVIVSAPYLIDAIQALQVSNASITICHGAVDRTVNLYVHQPSDAPPQQLAAIMPLVL